MAATAASSPSGHDLQERVVEINRVAKVVKGGRRFSFTALVVVGDEQLARSGSDTARPTRCPLAIQKGVERARKNLFEVPMYGTTIPHQVTGVFGAGRVLLKPASEGTGVIAGGGVRAVLELAGHPRRAVEVARLAEPDQSGQGDHGGPRGPAQPAQVAQLRGLSVAEVLGMRGHARRPRDERRGGARRGGRRADGRIPPRPDGRDAAHHPGQSANGARPKQRDTLRTLGLGRIGRRTEREDQPDRARRHAGRRPPGAGGAEP